MDQGYRIGALGIELGLEKVSLAGGGAIMQQQVFFFFQAEDGIRDLTVTGVQTCALPIWFINTSGAIMVKGQYGWAEPFKEGAARVGIMIGEPYPKDGVPARDGKEGYIDKTGRPITELKFDKAWDFSEGMAQVRVNGKWGYINKNGSIVISPQYDETQPFKKDFAGVKVKGLWGFIDKT